MKNKACGAKKKLLRMFAIMASYNYMMSADEVAQELNCSKSHAYKLVKAMNKELAAQGYITMAGRIPKAFWAKKMYGYEIAGN